MKPPARRGGYFKARANAWQEAHIAARWTAENPAPQWWAELDAAWQADQGLSPSIRDFADFLGWGKGRADRLLSAVAADLATWARDKNGTKTGQQRDSSGTDTGQPEEVQSQKVPAEQDSGGTVARQSRDISRARSSYPDYRPQPSDSDLNMNMSPPAPPAVQAPPAPAAPSAAPAPKPKPPPTVAQLADEQAIWAAWKMFRKGGAAAPPKLERA